MKHELSTIFVIRLTDGSERQHRYPYVMGWREAQDRLDPVLDEMDGGNICSPVYVVRNKGNGKTETEEVKIYSPVERWDGLT